MTRLHNGTYWMAPPRPVRTRAADYDAPDGNRAYESDPVEQPVMRLPWALRLMFLISAVVWLLALVGIRSLFAQVDAVLVLHGRDAQMQVANPTRAPLRVTITLFTDTTLTDSVPARISPSAFTLPSTARQVVRIRLTRAVPPGTVLRLATTFLPVEEERAPRPTMRFILATRIITRVKAGP